MHIQMWIPALNPSRDSMKTQKPLTTNISPLALRFLILLFLSSARSRCSSADWDTFQIPHSPSYQPVPAARLVFTLSWAPPCYHGDAAVTCQFHGGDAHRLVMAQNRMVGAFRWEWESTTASLWGDEQLTRKISRLYTNVAYCVLEADRVPFRRVTGGRDPGSECVGKAWCSSNFSFRCVDRVVPLRLSI